MTDPRIPAGIGPTRTRILEVALGELGAREEPNGSNRGPRIDKYLPAWWLLKKKGPSWCAFFVSWVVKKATGSYLPGGRQGACHRLMLGAQKADVWMPRAIAAPVPGDVFIMDTDGDAGLKGHTGLVLRVSEDGKAINTIEGNSGNKVRIGVRHVADRRILGWIDPAPDEVIASFERGLVDGEKVEGKGTR